MKVEFFIDAGIFYIVRSYDDDYVIILLYKIIIFKVLKIFFLYFFKISMDLHGDYKFNVFYKTQNAGYRILFDFFILEDSILNYEFYDLEKY